MSIKKYIKNQVEVQAIKYTRDTFGECIKFLESGGCEYLFSSTDGVEVDFKILTLEGEMRVSYGDYIIRGIIGEYYSCKPDVFEITYSEAIDYNYRCIELTHKHSLEKLLVKIDDIKDLEHKYTNDDGEFVSSRILVQNDWIDIEESVGVVLNKIGNSGVIE